VKRSQHLTLGSFIALCLLVSLVVALHGADQPLGEKVDGILIEKAARRMTLLHGRTPVKVYTVALGGEPVGPKEREGDGRTPEGDYLIDARNARSHYHLSLHVSYPNPADLARARKLGVNPGGAIMIHGLPNGIGWIGSAHRLLDWTKGCVAVTNAEIDEIWRLVAVGTPVKIVP
jgi:murein L,D-transpeptidase YafK